MITHRHVVPVKLMEIYPTILSRPNENLLIPWRLLALSLHFTGWLTLVDAREAMIKRAMPEPIAQEDYDLLWHGTMTGLAATLILLVFSSFSLLTGRMIRLDSLNLMHACFHTIGAIWLVEIWHQDAHVWRIWHVWIFCSLLPALVEAVMLVRLHRRGTFTY